jgi:hypothetical protein
MHRPVSPPRSSGWILAILLVGTFMTSLDVTIVNVAAPAIQADLGLSGAVLQLVVNGYSVALASLIIVAARLGDDRGHRRLFLAGLAGFTGASLLCGVSWSPEVLVAARIAQGAAAAAMVPQVITIIQLRFAGADRVRALALQASVIAGGAVAGQVAGGALVDLGLAGVPRRLGDCDHRVARAPAPARRAGRRPARRPLLLRQRAVGVGLASIALQMVAYGGCLFTLTLQLQSGLGESPLHSGLTFAPYAVGFALTSLACAQLPEYVARRVGPRRRVGRGGDAAAPGADRASASARAGAR